MHKRTILPALVGTLLLAACGGNEPPQQVQPQPDSAALAAERARQAELEEQRRREAAERERLRREEEARRRAEEEAARAREIIEQMVHFEFDKSDIGPEAERILTEKVGVLRANPAVSLRIVGHADERGSDEYNIALGMRRAQAVKTFLTGFGLAPDRFETVSRGEEQPLNPASNEMAWAQNRRAEFVVTAGQVTKLQ
ncbi:MAG TPA: OmpA family protein [Longimicrobiales bacterium]